ncbi:MAG: hypothetical protein HY436_01620 [Candidatus Liptonbacteria bacterium]|nr:hypothetical protein [Candidatus Liptonbacteria bacterium]
MRTLVVLLVFASIVGGINFLLLQSSVADMKFRHAVDPIAQELIVKAAQHGGWEKIEKICDMDQILIRPSGYARCYAMGGPLPRISVTVWGAMPLDAQNLIGSITVTTDTQGNVYQVKHQRGA